MQVFCDFDGTIALQDTTDILLKRFAAPAWEAIEAQWEAGLIGSAECMQQQIALIHASQEDLNAVLDDIIIDPTFVEFVHFCETKELGLSILSDGTDYSIKRILRRYGLAHLPVVANHLSAISTLSYKLESPFASEGCPSGVCKCQMVNTDAKLRVFIGDGRSDFCAANKVDLVFAKKSLATFCEKQAIPYIPYQHFSDIQNELTQILSGLALPSLKQDLLSTI